MALNLAHQTESLVQSYLERLRVFTHIVMDKDLSRKSQSRLIQHLFEDFSDLVAITVYIDKAKPFTVYDNKVLQDAGLSSKDLEEFREQHPRPVNTLSLGQLYIENSTISKNMPTFTFYFSQKDNEGKLILIAGVIQLNKLLNLTNSSKVFELFLLDSNGTVLSHADNNKVIERQKANWLPDLTGLLNSQSYSMSSMYKSGDVEMIGGFSSLKAFGLVAGAQIPKTAAFLTAQQLIITLTTAAFGLLLISALSGWIWSRRITKPLIKLSSATQLVAKGNYEISLESNTKDEIGDLAIAFNSMTIGLNEREIALKKTQEALVQSEKMSAFGQMGAGIAHEIKNPLAGILGFAQLLSRKLGEDNALIKYSVRIEKETVRCKDIIDNLMRFARQEKQEFMETDINSVIKSALEIVDHQLTINGVKIEQGMTEDLPTIQGNGNQIQQTIINFMINAQQAMEGTQGDRVKVSTFLDDNMVVVQISDNGPGIPKDIQAKIFEPFFTTKEAGKGTGLGLSVTFGIIEDHHGELTLESEPGEGATFSIKFPVKIEDNKNIDSTETQSEQDQ